MRTSTLLPLIAMALAGCVPGVRVDGAFNPDSPHRGGFANYLVVGVSPDVNQRCAFEQALAASLRSRGVKATMSCSVMDTGERLTREGVEKAVASAGADAVVATSLVAVSAGVKEGGTADTRGAGYYKATGTGFDYGYGYWGAYGVPVIYGEFETAPSVFTISGTAELESRLFATRDAGLVYSLKTRADGLASREMAVAEIGIGIADRLHADRLLDPAANHSSATASGSPER